MGRTPSPSRRRRSKSRERDRTDRDRRRRRSRSRDRERRRRSTERDHERRRDDRRRDDRSWSRSRSRSRSIDRNRSKRNTLLPNRPPVTDADLEGKSQDEQEMMKLMGFCTFDSTKGKKVENNEDGAVHVILKRKYRQYMNRKGGFNRPLDFVA